MTSLNSTILNICKKYSCLDSSIIEERNSILDTKEFISNICNMITTRTSDNDLARQIMCSSLGGGQKVLTEIIQTNEELGTSNFNNTISWKWTKAQLKVNEQRDKIDKLICELVKVIIKENDIKENDTKNVLDEPPSLQLDQVEQTQCENDYLEMVEQKAQDEYETYLAIKSFMYGVIGALAVNVFVAYLNIKH
jgi:hypothetical protein